MEKIDFNEGWYFQKENETGHKVRLPHDAMQEEMRSKNALSGSGGAFFECGKYNYIKHFMIPAEWNGQKIIFEFEGVYPNAEVFLNDKRIGGCRYGYSVFYATADSIQYGKENILRVEADNTNNPNSRWYSGAGIYRPVWMWKGEQIHCLPDGIQIRTTSLNPVQIFVETEHVGGKKMRIDIFYHGVCVAHAEKILKFANSEEKMKSSVEIQIPNGKLWSAEMPELYQCRVTLIENEEIKDIQTVDFGIRTVSWSTDGLFINDKQTLLKGGCIHHDQGILGARTFAESEYRRIKKMKEKGFNAVRSAHNPASPALLAACDALGMYVMDETWDMWYRAKNHGDYASEFMANYMTDIRSIVKKDYNHPSVIMYSIGNEVSEPAEEKGVKLAEKLVSEFHNLDESRPVTAGINLTILLMNAMTQKENQTDNFEVEAQEKSADEGQFGRDGIGSTEYNEMVSKLGEHMDQAAGSDEADRVASPVLDLLDIAGYNYASSRYGIDGEKHPERIIVGSETFPYKIAENWVMVKKYPYLIGDFMWTAWDYLGEVGLGAWSYEEDAASLHKEYPWLLADTGAFDILGNDNAEAGLAEAVWSNTNIPYIGVVPVNHKDKEAVQAIWRGSNAIPYWSYQNCDGNEAVIEIYSCAAEVAAFINKREIGRAKPIGCKVVFSAAYEPGELSVIAYTENGDIYGENKLYSADKDTRISISQEGEAKIGEILYLDIDIVGSNGQIECNRDDTLTIKVSGGELLAFGSANPKTEQRFLEGIYTTWYGRSQAVVFVTEKEITVTVYGAEHGAVNKKIIAKE